jgi:hypothetical protein
MILKSRPASEPWGIMVWLADDSLLPGAVHASRAIGPDDAILVVAYSSGSRTYHPA